jgi:non-heme chloroperoxidase
MSAAHAEAQAISNHEAEQVARANASGHTPVGLVHGLRLLPRSWDRWAGVFEDAGYATVTAGWPDDPETVEEAKAHPEVFANKSGAAGKWRKLGRPPTDSPTV